MLYDATGQLLPLSSGTTAATASVRGTMAFSPWFATQPNEQRKQLWTFGADPSGQLSPAARCELDVLAQTLYKNSGLPRALKNIIRIVGSLKPQARTKNADYNKVLEDTFRRVAESPLLFDAAGEEDFYSYQGWITEERLVRGELFTIFTEGPGGSARIAARGAHTVKGKPENGADGWRDGILTDDENRPLSYYFPGVRRAGFRTVEPRTVPAGAVMHHRNPHGLGALRGVTSLAHAINHIRDILEITNAQKQSIKIASEVAITRKADTPHNTTPSSLGLNAQLQTDPFAPPDFAGAAAPDEPQIPSSFEAFVKSGLFSSVPLDVLHDDRPHPNAMALREELKREIAAGLGIPHQVLFFMDDPGGAWSRIILEALVFFIAEQHLHLRRFCQRFWVYALSREMEAGRCPRPPADVSPDNMWKVRWMPPRSMTADIAKLGRLSIDMHRALLTSFSKQYEELGLDWEEELIQFADEVEFCRKLEKERPLLRDGDLTGWLLNPGQQPPGAAGSGGANTAPPAATAADIAQVMEQLTALAEQNRQFADQLRVSRAAA